MTKPIAAGDTISVHYTGKLADGDVFDSSQGQSPLKFTVGAGQLIKGFDGAVIGMVPGEKKTVTILPVDGYGDHQADEVFDIARSTMPPDMQPQIGMGLEVADNRGYTMQALVVEVNEETVKLDLNHPLAGKTLVFDIEIVETGLEPDCDCCEDDCCNCGE